MRAAADAAAGKLAEAEEQLAKAHEAQSKAAGKLAEYKALIGPAKNAENLRLAADAMKVE